MILYDSLSCLSYANAYCRILDVLTLIAEFYLTLLLDNFLKFTIESSIRSWVESEVAEFFVFSQQLFMHILGYVRKG